ncbi:MAG: galactose ABC transporter substrate-binding protein [Spirochaetales bacterium]|nr:galactose ABC transporter substrate-binding protein [Spirochaetales bacterium]
MNKINHFILCCLFLLSLGSCRSETKQVDMLLYNQDDLFINSFYRQIVAMAEDSVNLTVHDARNSQILQNETLELRLREGSDLMLINPVDRLGAYSVIKRLRSENIPVIYFNRQPLHKDLLLWEQSWYVGARAEQSGQMQADLVMDLFGGDPENLNEYDRNGDGKIQTVILKGEQGHQDAEIRTSEVVGSFRRNGFKLDILVTEVANWDRNEAYEKMGEILKNFGDDIELILSNNDAMALGAISRMRQSGVFTDSNGNGRIDRMDEGWIPVLGIDGIEQAVEQIQAGYLYGTVENDSASMARAIAALSQAVLEETPLSDLPFPVEDDKYIWIDYQPFIMEN